MCLKKLAHLLKNFIFMIIFIGPWSSFGLGKPITVIEVNFRYESLTSEQRKVYEEVANNLRCPTCTALSIQQSEAPFSLQMRTALLEQVEKNQEPDKIYDFFTERYGLWILRKPPAQGFHYLAWLVPLGVFFLGGAFVWWQFWRPRDRKKRKNSMKKSNFYEKQLSYDLEQYRSQSHQP